MLRYSHVWPLIKRLPPEFAHALALAALRFPVRVAAPPADPFTWGGLTFRNRVGVAAGFDKNAACLAGVERLGAGFLEVGTVLWEPWAGNRVSPRMARLLPQRGIWNRLGFTSRGIHRVARNLERVARSKRRGMVVACNIGPHPGKLKQCASRAEALALVLQDFRVLCAMTYGDCDMYVLNLSSPNTPGLRSLLQSPEIVQAVMSPIVEEMRESDRMVERAWRTPVLVKLPPEDENREPWNEASLGAVVGPMLAAGVCDGFVAVNTSTRLALKFVQGIANPELPGGVSGEPLRDEALRVVRMLRSLIGPSRLLIGCGGVMEPAHARQFLDAGADLVEIYSGMIYAGPGLIARSAAACVTPP
jgi:dihydroorotate dehydrogenase